jgi:hypothetical protein
MMSTATWRPADEALLQRLLGEEIVAALFRFYLGGARHELPRRAGGLAAELRRIGAPLGKEPPEIARFLDALVLREQRPELLHHLALFHARAATVLSSADPERAASAWVRSLSAWLALVEEGAYLKALEAAICGVSTDPARAALELVEDVGRRADAAARDLTPDGRAALLALARTNDAARAAAVPEETSLRVRRVAVRRRTGAIEAALTGIADALHEGSVRGDLGTLGTRATAILLRTLDVWTWASRDVAVEHFLVERLEPVGWELYRARKWEELGALLLPFRPMFESLATRIEDDPSEIAYASAAAQMFVFEAEVEDALPRKLAFAERAVAICPTHRNGRLVLATLLCRQATTMLRAMVVFARKDDLARAAALVERAEALYPQTSQLGEVKAMLARARKNALL